MKRIALALIFLLAPASASAEALTKTELFQLYAKIVNRDVVAQRMEQMYGMLDDTGKNQAKVVLKQDLLDAIQARLDHLATLDDPILEEQANIQDTTLP